MKSLLSGMLVAGIWLFATPALATHDDGILTPDDDIVFADCQDPKDSVVRAGRRTQCDLEAKQTQICDDGSVVYGAEGELAPESCTITPYLEGPWRRYNANRDYLSTLPGCLDGEHVYVCVGSPPQFVP